MRQLLLPEEPPLAVLTPCQRPAMTGIVIVVESRSEQVLSPLSVGTVSHRKCFPLKKAPLSYLFLWRAPSLSLPPVPSTSSGRVGHAGASAKPTHLPHIIPPRSIPPMKIQPSNQCLGSVCGTKAPGITTLAPKAE